MKKLGQLFVRNATWRGVAVLGVVFVAFNVLFAILGQDLEQTPDTLGFVGGQALVECFASMGLNGIEAYQPIALFDLSYPFVYATLLSFLLALLRGTHAVDAEAVIGRRMMLPWLAAVADWIENVSVLRYMDEQSYAVFMGAFPEPSESILTIWAVGHNLKWAVLALVLVLVLVEAVRFRKARLSR